MNNELEVRMIPPRQNPGPKPSGGPYAKNAGISLYPAEQAFLDRIKSAKNFKTRADAVRWLMDAYAKEQAA